MPVSVAGLDFRAGLDQEPHHLFLPGVNRRMQKRRSAFQPSVHIGAIFQERLRDTRIAFLDGNAQWRAPMPVPGIDVCAMGDQHCHKLFMFPGRRFVQRRCVEAVDRVHIRAVIDQCLRDRLLSPHGRVVQRCVAHTFFPNVDSCPVSDQHERRFRVVVLGRKMQRRPAV